MLAKEHFFINVLKMYVKNIVKILLKTLMKIFVLRPTFYEPAIAS